jgi:dolichol-phosphate mannosyltransferase
MTATLVIIPTFNEALNIESIVARVRRAVPEAHVLVVDDGSPDGTGALAAALAAADPSVHLLQRERKEGLGRAYGAAFRWGLARGYDRLVEMDADGSHLPEQLPRLLAASAAGADLVIGSRWIPGGGAPGWSRRRVLISRTGSAYARLLLGLPVRDTTAGYRVFTAQALRAIRLADVHSQGYGFQVDMLWHAVRAGLRVVEVPVTFIEREHGTSKMSLGIVVEAMLRVTVWGLRALPARARRLVGARR